MNESETDTSEMSTKEQRLAYLSGWLYLCEHESVHLLIDALLQVDPKKSLLELNSRNSRE